MRAAALLLLAGCQYVIGIEPTKLQPDAPPIDGAPDAPPPAPVDVGDGHDGPLTVSGVTYTDELRVSLTSDVGAGSTLIKVTDVMNFKIDDEILIIQMAGDNAGQHETVHITSTLQGQLIVKPALLNTYAIGATGATQVIRVPNWTDVTILGTGRMTAHAWDGTTGGVVAFRAKGTLDIQQGGVLDADALGSTGGAGTTGALHGVGGQPGTGGAKTQCFALCTTQSNATNGTPGNPGSIGLAGQGGPGQNTGMCFGGIGGRGGQHGAAGGIGQPAMVGNGIGGGASNGGAGTNMSINITHPVLGGGGGGGRGGDGGDGAGGGGGGGGSIGNGDGTDGTQGQNGGDGGAGAVGGRGAGLMIVNASTITIEGMVSARGEDGSDGTMGTDGGKGGAGGFGGAGSCNGATSGGRGAGGNGGNGGDGGGGGGGGGGGSIELAAFSITGTSGMARATGGAGGMGGMPGAAGAAGDGFMPSNPANGAQPGNPGDTGAVGTTGGNGFFYLRYVDTCAGCSLGDPAATVIHIQPM